MSQHVDTTISNIVPAVIDLHCQEKFSSHTLISSTISVFNRHWFQYYAICSSRTVCLR